MADHSQDHFTYQTFLSPFTFRYGSPAMRALWSEHNKRRLWRRMWVALAEAEAAAGLVRPEQVAELRVHQDEIDVEAAQEIEKSIHHDLMAELRVYAGQCPLAGSIIHLGATSMDIEDNADVLRLREALGLLRGGLTSLLSTLAEQIGRWADTTCMAYTHLQPAEPTTVGYRLAMYAQDLLIDLVEIEHVMDGLRGKGIKGAVGTGASYAQLLDGTALSPALLERLVMEAVGLSAFPIAAQTYPRKQDWLVSSALMGMAASLYKAAFDLRVLQSPAVGEWSEPFGAQQVGSSAMPFKRNPINAEKIDSLARLVSSLGNVAWENAAHSLLERTLDDSANRREMFPVMFLALDEMLRTMDKLIGGLLIDERAVERNVQRYGIFAAVERLLMELAKQGADRQAMHELLRGHSMKAWAAVADGAPNPLMSSLSADTTLHRYLTGKQIRDLLNAANYVGDAPQRARALQARIQATLGDSN